LALAVAFGVIVSAFALFSCGGTPPASPSGARRILFVGNSLTSANHMTEMVQALADAAKPGSLEIHEITQGGASLEDQWESGAVRAIRGAHWDVVVLQQGPTALPASRAELIQSARKFAPIIRKAGARPALYMVWPLAAATGDIDASRESYAAAAHEVNGIFFPAGAALRVALRDHPSLELWGSDGFHPTLAGSYGVALVIASMLCDVSPRDLKKSLVLKSSELIALPESTVTALQDAAAEAIRLYGIN
ncbi:MAG: SGNH/GDSL hydrolase family protein, partial [Bryobacteraceae bacterium]